MTPGPTRVPERVLRAGARPMIHHRTREFSRELAACSSCSSRCSARRAAAARAHHRPRRARGGDLQSVLGRRRDRRLLQRQVRRDVGRVRRVVRARRASHLRPTGSTAVDTPTCSSRARAHPRVRAVALAYRRHVDRSVRTTSRRSRARSRRADLTLVLVDGVSSIGGMPFAFDAWGVDFAVTASQKCLMSSPGLSFAACSATVRGPPCESSSCRATTGTSRRSGARSTKARPETPGTPPVAIVLQVAEALRLMHEEGLDAVYERHARLAERARQAPRSSGSRCNVPNCPGAYSTTLTAIALPAGIAPARVARRIKAARRSDGRRTRPVRGGGIPHRPHGRHPAGRRRAHVGCVAAFDR